MFGIVDAVVQMPPAHEVYSLTAVRFRTPEGTLALHFKDSPMAATLKIGEWAEFNKVVVGYGEMIRTVPSGKLQRLAGAASVTEVRNELEMMMRVFPAGALPSALNLSSEQRDDLAEPAHSTLRNARNTLRLSAAEAPMPDDYVLSLLDLTLASLAREYVKLAST